ncbi:MAG: hypothetical protein ABJP02_00275 [Parasphingorhabdus sp.]|uniref:hypothetical protein n=1 Tax=Alphaproteobacteria TaxID=28211 RepID=UPI0032988014
MAIYKRDAVLPDWEPMPWTMASKDADKQEQGFHERAMKPTVWQKIRWNRVPEGGIFGHSADLLRSKDVSWFTSFEEEDYILIDNTWFGFPDPPRWGLASRRSGQDTLPWQHWGHFPDVPLAWILKD